MITPVRQGLSFCVYSLVLCVFAFSACDEPQSEDDFYGDEYTQEEEYVYDEDDVISDEDVSIYTDETYYDDDYRDPPEPQLGSVPPVGDVVSDAKWDEITKGVSFERTEPEKPEEPDEPEEEYEERGENTPGIDFGQGIETGLSTIAWILVIALIIGVLAWFLVRTKVDTSVEKVRDFSLTDELLAASKEELADALTQNLNRQDYRAAIRYRFGQLLQEMRKKGLLIWVPGRTNAEYQSNLQDPFFHPFGVLAKAFSYALYSGRETTLAHYEEFAADADSFLALFATLSPKPNQR